MNRVIDQNIPNIVLINNSGIAFPQKNVDHFEIAQHNIT